MTKAGVASSDFAGLSLNERMFLAGRLDDFHAAIQRLDRPRLLMLLRQVELEAQAEDLAYLLLAGRMSLALLKKPLSPTVRLNRYGREVWFKRWWVYHAPNHWKGWLLIATSAPIAAGPWLLMRLLNVGDGPARILLASAFAIIVTERLVAWRLPTEPEPVPGDSPFE